MSNLFYNCNTAAASVYLTYPGFTQDGRTTSPNHSKTFSLSFVLINMHLPEMLSLNHNKLSPFALLTHNQHHTAPGHSNRFHFTIFETANRSPQKNILADNSHSDHKLLFITNFSPFHSTVLHHRPLSIGSHLGRLP